MSVRAEILRLGLRMVSRRSGPGDPDIAAIRRRLETVKRYIPGPARGTTRRRFDIAGIPALAIERPQSRHDHHVLYLHGGAYAYGSFAHYRDFIWRVGTATRARVLCIDYRLAPEHPFPAALEDAVIAYRWLLSSGADPRRIAIMGNSAGGGLTLATLLRLRDDGIPLPGAAVALSPWTDLALTGPSLRLNARADPMLDAGQAGFFAGCFLAGADPRNPHASPLYGDPRGLPPILIQVGSDEILLDDSTRIADKIQAAGGHVELQVWPRMPHVWPLFARVLPEGRDAIRQIGGFVQRMTGGDRPAEP